MRIVVLIENTEGTKGCIYAHGLSFYIETAGHRLLSDVGPSEDTLKNAEMLGIDLRSIDTVILSHGHYDHSGGILPFSEINNKAHIYMQKTATGDFYADDGENAVGERFRYIGIDKRIQELPQVICVSGDHVIDDKLELLTIHDKKYEIPFTNKRLLIRGENGYMRDTFEHEHYLVIREGEKRVLVSGCAHNGVPNIMDAYIRKYQTPPDMMISGFHLMKKTEYSTSQRQVIEDTAKELLKYPTSFATCHCTGTEAYAIMKDIMGDKLIYAHSGDEIEI